ncbi:putative F-box domain, leucine-rich repeat domain superfamily, F-box-like domain superfamily [Helianthus annuus]|nr:putative F-box domain, leucine-rich repeat domain superfamily, F-box-like domain superfamily [Helianthus annuus]
MNVEDDRLSSLPDDLIHKILSFMGTEHAVQTSVLSSRWRFIWTSMPYLNLSHDDFFRLPTFSKFFTRFLSDRNNQSDMTSVKLSVHGHDTYLVVKQIMAYALSHNIQQLNLGFSCNIDFEFPLCLFTSRSLKHLSLTTEDFSSNGYRRKFSFTYVFKATSTWDLPALTTLSIHDVYLCYDENTDELFVDLFSKCANLKNLTLKGCYTKGFTGLSICLPLLTELTLETEYGSVEVFNIVAPQLKNLTIRSFISESHEYLISAPHLVFLDYKGWSCLQLSTNAFLSLEKAHICISYSTYAHQVLRLLQQIRNVKFLTLNLEVVELLSSFVELLAHLPSPFANLKSLKIHPERERLKVREHKRVEMSAEVRSYLLDGSPGATFTMVSREDIKSMKKLAENLRTMSIARAGES